MHPFIFRFSVPEYDISYALNSNDQGEQVAEYRAKRDISD